MASTTSRRACRRLLPALVAIGPAVAACAPVLVPVYVADVPAGRIVYSTCPMNSHIPAGATMRVAAATAIVSLNRRDGRTYLELRLDVPEGTTVALQDGTVTLETAAPDTRSRAEFPLVSLVDNPIVNNWSTVPGADRWRMPLTAPLVGQRIVAGDVAFDRHFWLATWVDTAAAADVWVSLPRFVVDGAPVTPERLHFRRQRMVAMAVINC